MGKRLSFVSKSIWIQEFEKPIRIFSGGIFDFFLGLV